jgi:Kdo2-lipid IVA lauroyltransferase/acyltransferase
MAYPVARLIARTLARLTYAKLTRRRRAQVIENFSLFLPERNDYDELYETACRQLFSYIVEEFHLRILSRRKIKAGCTFTNIECIENHLRAGRKVVVAAAHQGNLDWVWLALCLNFPDADMAMVGRRFDIRWLDRHLKAMRERFGKTQILNTDLGRHLLRARSVPEILCLVTDLEPMGEAASRANTSFLGQPVTFYNTLPRIAARFDMAVIYLDVTRKAYGRFEVGVSDLSSPPARNDKKAHDELQATYVRAVEKSVRRNPADWLFWWLRLTSTDKDKK